MGKDGGHTLIRLAVKTSTFIFLSLMGSLAVESAHATGPFWNQIGEKACHSSRNYIQDRVREALEMVYKSQGIKKPRVTNASCVDCLESRGTPSGLSGYDAILKQIAGFYTEPPYYGPDLVHDIQCIQAARSYKFKYEAPKTLGPDTRIGKEFIKMRGREYVLDCVSSSTGVEHDFAHSPCESPELMELLALAFRKGADCSGLKTSELFPLFTHESGFHPIIRSPGHAAGIGQLTSIAIKDIALIEKTRYVPAENSRMRSVKAVHDIRGKISSDPSCSVFDLPTHPVSDTYKKCELMVWPKAIFLNLAVAMKHFASQRAIADHHLEDDPRVHARFPDKKDREKLIIEATYYNYNGGVSFISNLKAYALRTSNKKKPLEEILNDYRKYLLNERPASDFPKTVKRHEVANYVRAPGGVLDCQTQVDKKRGGACFHD